MTAVEIAPPIAGYRAGTWTVDTAHSEVGFSVRHLMVTKVRGRFDDFAGTIVTGETPLDATVEATVALDSIATGNADRDTHLRSSDFFDTVQHESMRYRSRGVRFDGDGYVVDGDLSLHGETRAVPLRLEIHGIQERTPFGDTRFGLTATAEIDRRDFGISFNTALEGGGVGLGNKVEVTLEIQAILQEPPEA